ncbi:MAG: hypothetical protein RLZZ598_1337 [Pseudomonadota bacterium]|jgi:hypothetical protein
MKPPISSQPARGLLFSLVTLCAATPLLAADPAPATKPTAAKPVTTKPVAAKPVPTPASAPASDEILSFGKGTPTGPLLTRDQLRACLKVQADIKASGGTLRTEKAELGTISADLEKTEAALVAERATIDANKVESVDAYNTKLKSAQAAASELKTRQLAFNQKVEAYQASNESFKRDCADRPYTELDWFAIQRGQ